MNKIEKLIQELCPDGVLQVSLGTAITESTARNPGANVKRVRSVTNSNGLVDTNEFWENSRTSADTSSYKLVRPGMFVYNPSRINIGSISWNKETKEVIVSPMYVVFGLDETLINTAYLMHFFSSSLGRNLIESSTEQGARFRLPFENLAKLLIQIPPIRVQQEIVSILDKFKELEAGLQAELEARVKQFQFFRSSILDFRSKVDSLETRPIEPHEFSKTQFVELGELVRIRNGKDYKHLNSGQNPVYGSGGVMTYVDGFAYDKPSVLIPRKGSLANLFYVDVPFWTVDTIFWTEVGPDIEAKYLYHVLSTYRLEELNLAGGVPSLTQTTLNALEIPVPTKEMQLKIVKTLDHFSSLIADAKSGLPAEIQARRKQYEYYRNKLLTFKGFEAA